MQKPVHLGRQRDIVGRVIGVLGSRSFGCRDSVIRGAVRRSNGVPPPPRQREGRIARCTLQEHTPS